MNDITIHFAKTTGYSNKYENYWADRAGMGAEDSVDMRTLVQRLDLTVDEAVWLLSTEWYAGGKEAAISGITDLLDLFDFYVSVYVQKTVLDHRLVDMQEAAKRAHHYLKTSKISPPEQAARLLIQTLRILDGMAPPWIRNGVGRDHFFKAAGLTSP
jgi:hypothetical protein